MRREASRQGEQRPLLARSGLNTRGTWCGLRKGGEQLRVVIAGAVNFLAQLLGLHRVATVGSASFTLQAMTSWSPGHGLERVA